MNSAAYLRLKEQIRLRQLRAAVQVAEGGMGEMKDVLKQATHQTNELTERIRELSGTNHTEEAITFPYNEKQQEFIDVVLNGQPVALTGPAGSGKTTAVKGAIQKLISSGKIVPFGFTASKHKHLDQFAPGVVCTAFTNKAVENMKKVLPKELRGNCITIHKLLEYGPVYFDVVDDKTGMTRQTMQFMPKYDHENPLPSGIQTLIIDEASMVAVDLWNTLAAAIHHDLQVILIGDIQQLPPVFGKPIFIYAMQYGVHKVELTEVHRQALQSPIISLAHKILDGKQIFAPKLPELNQDDEHGYLKIQPWKKQFSDVAALKVMGQFLPELIDAGSYDPINDVILTPFNVNFGTVEINKIVATHLVTTVRREDPESKEAKVYEIIAGINKKYFRIGDKVLYNKTEHIITDIGKNSKYLGKHPRTATNTMDYYGRDSYVMDAKDFNDDQLAEVDDILASMSMGALADIEDGEKRKQVSSHVITLYSEMLDSTVSLETAGEVGNLEHGYAITVHKSQGSEYNRVLFITHHTQAQMLFRELIYTAVTRAKRELLIVCPPDLLVKGINSQRIPGKTLDDKIAAFERACQLQKGMAEKPTKMFLFKPKETTALS